MRVLLSAGEVSGDLAGAELAAALRAERPDLELVGLGGPLMAARGVSVLATTSHLGTVGVSEAVVTVPSFWRAFRAVRRTLAEHRLDAAVVIGNDVFNTLLARWLRGHRVPVAALFPPQVWIWGALAGPIGRSFDLVLTCFPQEHEVYARAARRSRPTVRFVGHYLADTIDQRTPAGAAAARARLGLDPGATVLGLLPGSRRHEVASLAPVLFGAARRLLADGRDLALVVPVADPVLAPVIAAALEAAGLAGHARLVTTSRDVLVAADLVLVASGTATLEAALVGVPMVVAYQVSQVTHAVVATAIALGLMERDTVALPNLLLGEEIVPELTQRRATAELVAAAARELLDDPSLRAATVDALGRVRDLVGHGAAMERAARAVLELAGAPP